MRIAVLGDIHSNVEALKTVLNDIDCHNVDRIVHTGDVVGYCTDISECISILQERRISGVHGNHDLMAISELSTENCVKEGIEAIHWTWSHIKGTEREYLSALPRYMCIDNMIVFHAAVNSVVKRIVNEKDALSTSVELDNINSNWWLGVHGHVHKQKIFEINSNNAKVIHKGAGEVKLSKSSKYIISAGSVGVSRDKDSSSAYIIIDTDGVVIMKRIPYDWKKTRRKIKAANLSTKLFVSKITLFRRRIERFIKKIIYILYSKFKSVWSMLVRGN